jgi:ArsR family transcriptional regulator
MELSEILKALGDFSRLRILGLLSEDALCVCMLAEVLHTPQPTVSKSLNRLRYSGIIKCSKVSQWCFYGVDDRFKERYRALLEFLLSELKKDEQFLKDKEYLKTLLNSDVCYRQLLVKRGLIQNN